MESKTNYTVVGLVVLILAATLFSAGLWLSVGFDRKKYDLYTVYVREPVTGLSDESLVKYNGVRVGLVSKIGINQFDPQQVKLELKIEEGTPITTSTQATLITQGITGTTYLGLSARSSSLFPLQKTPGEPYPVIPYKPSFFNQLEKNINDVSISIKRVFNKDNARLINKSLANIQQVTGVLAKNNSNLNQSLKELPLLLNGLKTSVGRFNTMANDMSSASKQVSIAMQSGKDGMDKLSEQTLPPLITLLQRIDLIAANLEKVSAQMRQNPAVIIRGNTPPQPGPGE